MTVQVPKKARLCIVLEATAFVAPFWKELRLYGIDPLLRAIDKGDFGPTAFEVALVVFRASYPYSSVSLENSGWTADLAEVRQMLDQVKFEGGGLYECNHVEGLAEAIHLCSRGQRSPEIVDQCLLLAATEVQRLSIPWPFPEDCRQTKGMASFEELALNIYKHHHMALSIMAPYTSLSRRLMMSFCYAAQQPATSALVHSRMVRMTPKCSAVMSPFWSTGLDVLKAAALPRPTAPAGPLPPYPKLAQTPGTDSTNQSMGAGASGWDPSSPSLITSPPAQTPQSAMSPAEVNVMRSIGSPGGNAGSPSGPGPLPPLQVATSSHQGLSAPHQPISQHHTPQQQALQQPYQQHMQQQYQPQQQQQQHQLNQQQPQAPSQYYQQQGSYQHTPPQAQQPAPQPQFQMYHQQQQPYQQQAQAPTPPQQQQQQDSQLQQRPAALHHALAWGEQGQPIAGNIQQQARQPSPFPMPSTPAQQPQQHHPAGYPPAGTYPAPQHSSSSQQQQQPQQHQGSQQQRHTQASGASQQHYPAGYPPAGTYPGPANVRPQQAQPHPPYPPYPQSRAPSYPPPQAPSQPASLYQQPPAQQQPQLQHAPQEPQALSFAPELLNARLPTSFPQTPGASTPAPGPQPAAAPQPMQPPAAVSIPQADPRSAGMQQLPGRLPTLAPSMPQGAYQQRPGPQAVSHAGQVQGMSHPAQLQAAQGQGGVRPAPQPMDVVVWRPGIYLSPSLSRQPQAQKLFDATFGFNQPITPPELGNRLPAHFILYGISKHREVMATLKAMHPPHREQILRGTCRTPLQNVQANCLKLLEQLNIAEVACQGHFDTYDAILMVATKGQPFLPGMSAQAYCAGVQPVCLLFPRETSPFQPRG